MNQFLVNMPIKTRYVLVFVLFLLIFQFSYSFSKVFNYQEIVEHAAVHVENRILIDLDTLHLAEPVYKIAGDKQFSDSYLKKLNSYLVQHNWPLRVKYVATEGTEDKQINIDFQSQFDDGRKTVLIGYKTQGLPWWSYVSVYPILASLLLVLLLRDNIVNKHIENKVQHLTAEEKAWMLVDLPNKRLVNAVTGKIVELSNKPLCFYCALLEFSIENENPVLNPNKELPEELMELANKYFFRLIELGHTIRKRPNFNNNLEKALSEIRAGLDELFMDDVKRKATFYPPKAIGEGSRSKLHNVALLSISGKDIEFLGK